MKKLVCVAILSLAGVGLSTGEASAWFFCHHCCGKAVICVRPYNAFSPSVFGTLCADGCYPFSCPGAGGCMPPPPPWMCGAPPWMGGGCCGPMDGGSPGGSPAPPAAKTATAPVMLLPGAVTPTMQPPPPAPMPVGATSGAQAYPTGIQATGYRAPLPWVALPAYPGSPNEK
jgi:hypothetical protein